MSRRPRRDLPNTDDGAMSEANSSIQVHLDASSVRGLSTSRTRRSASRRRSPSRNPDQSSSRQRASNSQSSGISSAHEPLPQEDLLIDLITPTEAARNSADDLLHGIKRPHDGESAGEPSPKRDKLGEELEQMMVEVHNETMSAPDSLALLQPSAAAAGSSTDSSRPSTSGARRVLPMRHARKRSSQGGGRHDERGGPSNPNS